MSDYPYRILIIRGSASRKTNLSFNLINQQQVIDIIYLDSRGPYKAKYQFFVKNWESTGLKHFNDSKTFVK